MQYSCGETKSITRSRMCEQPIVGTGGMFPGYAQIIATPENKPALHQNSTIIDAAATDRLLGWISPSYNDKPNNEKGYYHVKINWGDGNEWEDGQLEYTPGRNDRLEVHGTKSHPYAI